MTKGLALGSRPAIAMAFAVCGYVSLAVYKVHESSALLAQISPPAAARSSKDTIGDLPDVAIEAADGTRTSFAATAGQVRIATMIYAHCPGVCPTTIDALRGIERQLTTQQRTRLSFVLLSLDPARDSPRMLQSLARERGITSSHWLLGRTSERDAHAFASAVGLRFQPLSDGSIDHTTTLALIDPRGRLLARTDDAGETVEFVAAVRRALAGQ